MVGKSVRIATWNVNSIRTRVDRVVDWMVRAGVDVLAMQETKCADDKLPTMPFVAAGYEVAHCGHDQWNGVAIASRVGLDDVTTTFDGQPTTLEAKGRHDPCVLPRSPHVRSVPPAPVCGCGACTCPTAGVSEIRITATSWNGLLHCRIPRSPGYSVNRRHRSR